jgi:hypothetical protein
VGFIVLVSFGPGVLVSRGATLARAGFLVSLAVWVSAITVPLGGAVVDRWRRPDLAITVGCLVTALAIAAMPLLPAPLVWLLMAGAMAGLPPGADAGMPGADMMQQGLPMAPPGEETIRRIAAELGGPPALRTSAHTGEGLPELEAALEVAILGGRARAQIDPALLTTRQEAALHAALAHVRDACAALKHGLPADIVAVDARAALLRIGEITGESVTESLLNEIFARFCIGK